MLERASFPVKYATRLLSLNGWIIRFLEINVSGNKNFTAYRITGPEGLLIFIIRQMMTHDCFWIRLQPLFSCGELNRHQAEYGNWAKRREKRTGFKPMGQLSFFSLSDLAHDMRYGLKYTFAITSEVLPHNYSLYN